MAKGKGAKGDGTPLNKGAVEARRAQFVKNAAVPGVSATKAAIQAGYSPASADVTASRLLANEGISAAVQAARAKMLEEADISRERILREIARTAFFDPRKLYDDEGNVRPVSEWDDETASAVAGMDAEELWEGRGSDRERVGVVRKVRLHDKMNALDKLAKVEGLYEKNNRQLRDELSLTVTIHDPTSSAVDHPVLVGEGSTVEDGRNGRTQPGPRAKRRGP